MKSMEVAFLLAGLSISILSGIAEGIEARPIYLAMGAMFIGMIITYASDPTARRILRYTNICLTLAFSIIVALLILEYIVDISAYKDVIVLGVALAELLIVMVASRYMVLFIGVRPYRSYIVKILKRLNNTKCVDHKCNAMMQHLQEMVLGIRDGIVMYLREDHEYAIIRVVGAMERFLYNFRSLGFIQEKSFTKMIKELLEKYNMDKDEIGKLLQAECRSVYSLRSKYAHGDIPMESGSRELKLEPYKVSYFLERVKHMFEEYRRYQLAVFEALAVIAYSIIFTYRIIEILIQYCPKLKQLIEPLSMQENELSM